MLALIQYSSNETENKYEKNELLFLGNQSNRKNKRVK